MSKNACGVELSNGNAIIGEVYNGGGVAFFLYDDQMEEIYDVCYSNLGHAFSHGCINKMVAHGANTGNVIELLSNLYEVTPEFIDNLMKYREVFLQ